MINEKRIIDEFVNLATFDSLSFHEKNISNYLYDKLKKLGLEVTMDNAGHILNDNDEATGNIYGILKGNVKGKPILFSSHMDTVAPGIGKKVIIHSDGLVTSDGKTVLGADDISGIVTILETLEVIKENNLPHPDIEVLFFIAEEAYCAGSNIFDFSKVKSKNAYVFDLSGKVGTIANGAPTIIQFKAHIKGKSAHSGFEPEKGISAILVAAHTISNLKLGKIDNDTTANIGLINGGEALNIVPENVIVEGEIRSFDDNKALNLVLEFKNQFENSANLYNALIDFTFDKKIKAYNVSFDSYVIKRYEKALKELNIGEANIIKTFGGSDNNNFNKNNIEGIVVSNAMNNVHTTEEYFYIDELKKSILIALKLATMED